MIMAEMCALPGGCLTTLFLRDSWVPSNQFASLVSVLVWTD
jgi:mannitol-specific phosphotransferase system IIBC component